MFISASSMVSKQINIRNEQSNEQQWKANSSKAMHWTEITTCSQCIYIFFNRVFSILIIITLRYLLYAFWIWCQPDDKVSLANAQWIFVVSLLLLSFCSKCKTKRWRKKPEIQLMSLYTIFVNTTSAANIFERKIVDVKTAWKK